MCSFTLSGPPSECIWWPCHSSPWTNTPPYTRQGLLTAEHLQNRISVKTDGGCVSTHIQWTTNVVTLTAATIRIRKIALLTSLQSEMNTATTTPTAAIPRDSSPLITTSYSCWNSDCTHNITNIQSSRNICFQYLAVQCWGTWGASWQLSKQCRTLLPQCTGTLAH